MQDIKRLFRYHGAEHQNVNAYEKNVDLEIADIQAQTTIHPRLWHELYVFRAADWDR